VTVGTTDVLKNLRHRYPCVGDVANILESGYDVYKYMHLYVKTEDTADSNSFLLANSVTRALTGVQIGLEWKCAEKEVESLILQNTTSHEFSGMPHAPQNLVKNDMTRPTTVGDQVENIVKPYLTKDDNLGSNKIVSGDSMQRNSYDNLQRGGRGMNIKDIVDVFYNNKFITETMTFTSELLHLDTMII